MGRYSQPKFQIRQPFYSGPYLQDGGGLFGFLSNAASKFLPYISQAGKLAKSGLTKAAKSSYAKKVLKTGAQAALEGGKELLEGQNVKAVAKGAAGKVTRQSKRQLAKLMDEGIANLSDSPAQPPAKKAKIAPTKTKKKGKRNLMRGKKPLI